MVCAVLQSCGGKGGGGNAVLVLIGVLPPVPLRRDLGNVRDLGPETGIPRTSQKGPGTRDWEYPLVDRQTDAYQNITFPSDYERGR